MIVGVPKEIKQDEYRVAIVAGRRGGTHPRGQQGSHRGRSRHRLGAADSDYVQAGAELIDGPAKIFARADMIVKVKKPQATEIASIRKGQVVFTYFHLAADRELTTASSRRLNVRRYENTRR